MSNGDLFTWGDGHYGATGLSSQQNAFAPIKIELPALFTQVSCGKKHTLAIDCQGTVYVAGDNTHRQLGISGGEVMQFQRLHEFNYPAKKVVAGTDHSLILTNDGRVYSAGNNQNGNLGLGHNYPSDKFLSVNGLANLKFMMISAGRHSAALTEDNRLFVWGPAFVCEKALVLP